MSNKVDRIRKRIQITKKKQSIFNFPLDRSFVQLLQHKIETPSETQPLPSLPAIAVPIPVTLSHSLSKHAKEEDYSITGFHFSLVERLHQSLLIQNQEKSNRKCSERRMTEYGLTWKPLNSTIREHKMFLKNQITSSERIATQSPVWRAKTSPKVIIVDTEAMAHPALPPQPVRRTLKRPSFIEPIRLRTAPDDSSPLRKLSISGWQAPDASPLLP